MTPETHSAIIQLQNHFTMDYKPYSPEWHRKRYIKEALDKYFDDYVDVDIIREDIYDILHARANEAYEEYNRVNKLAESL